MAPAAFVFDVLDGRVARFRNTHSALVASSTPCRCHIVRRGARGAAFAAGCAAPGMRLRSHTFVCCGVSRLADITSLRKRSPKVQPKCRISKARR
jgi:CDP-diacylglycerol--serine O-phosphatidyltransferase